ILWGTKLLPPHPRGGEREESRRRTLIANLEQVTVRERTGTPIHSAISSRLFPCSTRFLICWVLSGVTFPRLPYVGSCVASSSVCIIFVTLWNGSFVFSEIGAF